MSHTRGHGVIGDTGALGIQLVANGESWESGRQLRVTPKLEPVEGTARRTIVTHFSLRNILGHRIVVAST